MTLESIETSSKSFIIIINFIVKSIRNQHLIRISATVQIIGEDCTVKTKFAYTEDFHRRHEIHEMEPSCYLKGPPGGTKNSGLAYGLTCTFLAQWCIASLI